MYPYLNINIRGVGPYPAQSSSKAPDNLPAGRRFENDEIPMSNANRFWYVLQTSFHRELQIQLQLNRMRIRSFIPMHYEETTESGRRRIRRKPAVHNLIFVRISPVWLQKIKTAKLIPAKCMYDKMTQMPLIVPDKQMDDFIALTEGKFEDCVVCKRLRRQGGHCWLTSDNPAGMVIPVEPSDLQWLGIVVRKQSEL